MTPYLKVLELMIMSRGLVILICAVANMMIISVYQYSWSLYAYALIRELGWSPIETSLAFTIYVYLSTFIQPLSGYLADTYGPRRLSTISSIIVGLGFMLSSIARSPTELYLTFGLGSLGVGILYGISTASAVKWFPNRRGLATGVVTFGFGAGASVFNLPIQYIINEFGLKPAFTYVGAFMMLALVPTSYLITYPKQPLSGGSGSKSNNVGGAYQFKPIEMLRTWQWYVIYVTFIATPTTALMFGAQLKLMATEFNIPASYLNLMLVLFPLANGLSRVIAGFVSDRIGRERTMVLFYSSLGSILLGLAYLCSVPEAFTLLAIMASLLSGAPYTFYPSIIGDYYGTKYATANYGITYTAKAWSGLIAGWITGYIVATYGTYKVALIVTAIITLIAALLSSPLILRPPRRINIKE